jgi:hypothetical protein
VRDNGRNTRELLIDPDSQQTQEAIGTTRQRITQAFATLEPLFDTAEGKAYAALKAASGNLRRRTGAGTDQTGRPRAGAGPAQTTGGAGRT